MDKQNWKKIEDIYDQAVLLDLDKQEPFVKLQADKNSEIYQQVMKMLNTEAQGFMQAFPEDIAGLNEFDFIEPSEDMTKLGHFKIIKKIATGGMGRVYLAQSSMADVPIKVALKTIRVELINDELKRRFQNEKNILSKLQHKNIASLIDAGVTENNIPYIATEWVDGKNIKDYCIQNKLSIKQRLKLFLQICSAMTFAHNKLIIHRDLKPDNILVNDQKQVKLLDFGIAKIVDENQSNQTQTQIFTPDYAAPEQLCGDMCTAATDIYSLGIILFEILTNSKRFNLAELPITEKIKAIAVPKLLDISDVQSGHKLVYSIHHLKGALYTIINKAMHVDPSRRYDSVSSLVADIENYLESRPIKAMNDSIFYKTKMLMLRNKLASGFLVLAFVGITSGLIVANKQLILKETEAKKSQQVTKFLIDSIQASDPDLTQGKNQSVVEFLQNAKVKIQEDSFDDESLEAMLKQTIGLALAKAGEYNDAEKLLLQSLSSNTYKFQTIIDLTKLYLKQGLHSKAQMQLFKLENTNNNLNENEKYLFNNLKANLLNQKGQFTQAKELIRKSISLMEKNNTNTKVLIESNLLLAKILRDEGMIKESLDVLYKALNMSKIKYGEVSTYTTDIFNQIAHTLSEISPVSWNDVFHYYKKTLDNQLKLYGKNHPIIAKTLLDEGFALNFIGEHEKAMLKASEAKKIALQQFSEKHMLTAHINLLISQISYKQGKLESAITQLYQVLNVYEKHYGKNNFTVNEVKTTLSVYLIKAKKGQEALANLLSLYRSQSQQLGENHKATLYVGLNIVKSYILLDETAKATNLAKDYFKRSQKHLGEEHIITIGLQIALAESFLANNNPHESLKVSQSLMEVDFIKNHNIYSDRVNEMTLKAQKLIDKD